MTDAPRPPTGLLLGAIVVLLWSTTSSLIVLGGGALGVWQFVAITSGLGGLAQLLVLGLWRRTLRPCLALPPRLWAVVILCFVPYGLMYPSALTSSANEAQKCGVNLFNYLWPLFTVLGAVLWVPGTRLTPRLAVGLALSLAGLLLANVGCFGALGRGRLSPWPYVSAGLAAALWGTYSSLLARWRDWARRYATPPAGFILLSLVSAAICQARAEWQAVSSRQWAILLAAGLGTSGLGYLLWELALQRADAAALGIMAALIPVFSTLLLSAVQSHPLSPALLAGALLVSVAVALTVSRTRTPQAIERRPNATAH